MKTLSVFVIAACCVVCTVCTQPASQSFVYPSSIPAAAGVKVDGLARIDSLLQDYVDKGILPHALTFVARNGTVVHNRAFGWSDVESQKALKLDDLFRNFSQTKAVTTVALMTLFEQGKFQLDDPVAKYIPECTDQVLEQLNDDGTYSTRPVASPLTIRHLLCHTSGITGNRNTQTLWQSHLQKRDNRPYDTLAEEVKDLVQIPLAFDPGTEWNYHPAADVWGYLVEYFSGMSLRNYVKETILTPLGMANTDWFFPETYRQRIVTAYHAQNGKLEAQKTVWSGFKLNMQNGGVNPFQTDIRYCQAGTGLYGPIEDYARFCQMILNGGTFNGKRILDQQTIALMSIDQLPHPNKGGDNFHFGLGFEIYPEKANEQRSPSPGSLHWSGAYNTQYLIDPAEGLIILFYTNCVPDGGAWGKFIKAVYQALE